MLHRVFRRLFANRIIFTISIRSRLMLYFLLLILLPTAVISVTLYQRSTAIIRQKINHSLDEKLNIIDTGLTQKLESLNDIGNEIYLSRDLVAILSSQHPYNTTEIISEMSVLTRLLETYSVTGVSQAQLIPRIYIFNRPEYLLYNFSNKVSDTSVIEQLDWYKNLPSHVRYSVVGSDQVTVSSRSIRTIKLAKRLFGLDEMHVQYGGVLTLDVEAEYFNQILRSGKPTTGSSTLILDARGQVLLSSDPGITGSSVPGLSGISRILTGPASGSMTEKGIREDFLVSYRRMAGQDWTLVSLTPMSDLQGELNTLNRVIFVVILLCSLLAIAMAMVLSDHISYPIRKLVRTMESVDAGRFEPAPEYHRKDEFAYLFSSYNQMIAKIKELIDKLYVSELHKREAELKSLQAQINPHFLYNTLDSVNWMALELKATHISTMVTSLSNFFRYSLSKGKSIIPLRDERAQAESYLKIQKIRFQDKLDYTLDLPQELLDFLTPKLILQPLVENALIHGIHKRRGPGHIAVTGWRSPEGIRLEVRDDGVGADIRELNAILTENTGSGSFAIRNVHARIRSTFGEGWGLHFEENTPCGLTAVVTLPATRTLEETPC